MKRVPVGNSRGREKGWAVLLVAALPGVVMLPAGAHAQTTRAKAPVPKTAAQKAQATPARTQKAQAAPPAPSQPMPVQPAPDAQGQTPAAQPAAGQTPVAQPAPTVPGQAPIVPPRVLPVQPSAPTPPTPLPTSPPNTDVTGVTRGAVQKTQPFVNPPGQPRPDAPEAVLTLEDALRIAFENNPSIQLATEQAVRTARTVDQIRSAREPQINASASYSRLLNSTGSAASVGGGVSPSQIVNPFGVGLNVTPPGTVPITLSGGSGTGAGGGTGSAGATTSAGTAATGTRATDTRQQNGGGTTTRSSFEPNQISARVGVSQFIDITGIVRAALQLGDLQNAQARLNLARTRQEVALNVRTGYFNVLRTLAFVDVNEAAVAQAQENLRVTQAQFDAGVASQFDVLRARTQLSNNVQGLISARNQVAIAKNAFANLLGLDPSTPVEPATVEAPPTPELNEEGLIATAYGRRPEYLQADVNILAAEKNTRLARRGQEPYLNASAGGVYIGTSGVPSDQRAGAALGLTLVFPLSDGGATRAAVDNARTDERTARIQKDQFTRGIKAEVQQAIVAVRDAQERREAAGATVEQAREALRLANVRFQAGVGTQLEINDAQTALTQAQTNEVNARYDYLAALARLNRATGTPE